MLINALRKKKILVTGGAGFIGSNIIEFLLSNDLCVRCLDNFSTGSKENVESFINNKNFELLEGDIRDLDTCINAVEDIDLVLHQAALGSVPRSLSDPVTTNNVNITGFLNMLIACERQGVQRFIYAASSSTYGDSKILPKVEDVIGEPISPYALTKRVNEMYANVFNLSYGLETIGLRYFNVFGKRQTPDGAYAAVIPKFIKKLLKYESPVLYGDGNNSRDFTYIENVIQANILAASTQNQNALNQVYNVAVGKKVTLVELFNHIRNCLQKFDSKIIDINYELGSERKGDVKHSLASIEKAKKLLGYQPTHDLYEGLLIAIPWYYENLVK